MQPAEKFAITLITLVALIATITGCNQNQTQIPSTPSSSAKNPGNTGTEPTKQAPPNATPASRQPVSATEKTSVTDPVVQAIHCKDIQYDNPNYSSNMDKLATLARLPNNYYSRYDEDVVGYLCKGDTKSIQGEVDDGYVKQSEVDGIKEALGLDDRSEMGMSYGYSRQKFSSMGLCEACADNVAQYYTKKPDSECGRLAKQALEGNPKAINTLQSFPDYCIWKYSNENNIPSDTSQQPSQSDSATKPVSVNDFILDSQNYADGQIASIYGLPFCINGSNCSLYADGDGVNSVSFTYQLPRNDREKLITCDMISNRCQATISGTVTHDDSGDISINAISIVWSEPIDTTRAAEQ
ncbi:hypothetical protein ABQJ54_00185 [Rhodanobacter sp. Si-c]|uniref:Uncharacterized protein n=1 Tax=Rhodanobacter lycopersici TaxID=3162487 RepID=A0ABV3Q8N0_9GAMM